MLPSTPPQVPGHFLLGSLFEFKQDPFKKLCEWHAEYGDCLSFKLAGRQYFMLSHPDYVEQILIHQKHNFGKIYDARKPRGLASILGQGLVTSDGDLWRKQRQFIQPVFQRKNLSTLLPKMVGVCDDMLQRWHNMPAPQSIELTEEMMRLTLEVITQTMFSTSVLQQVDQISPALEIGLRYAAQTTANPLAPPLYLPTPGNLRFKKAKALLDNIIIDLIENRRQSDTQQKDLLQMLLDVRPSAPMTDQQIRDELLTIFSAGHETTANVLNWTFYLLARHPHVLHKLRAEQQRVLQGNPVNRDNIQQLTYCKAVLNESMRIRPPVGFIMRKARKATTLCGYKIPAGSFMLINIFNLHHHTEFWPDADDFKPERFVHNEKRGLSFMPFGAGERICIGNVFASIEGQLLLTMISQQFNIIPESTEEAEIELAVTIRPKGGLKAHIEPLHV